MLSFIRSIITIWNTYLGYFVSNMKYKPLHKQEIVMDIQVDGPFIYYIPHHLMLKKIQNDCSFATFVNRHVNGLLWILLIKHKYPSQLKVSGKERPLLRINNSAKK